MLLQVGADAIQQASQNMRAICGRGLYVSILANFFLAMTGTDIYTQRLGRHATKVWRMEEQFRTVSK